LRACALISSGSKGELIFTGIVSSATQLISSVGRTSSLSEVVELKRGLYT
jgi:hypothetical protein